MKMILLLVFTCFFCDFAMAQVVCEKGVEFEAQISIQTAKNQKRNVYLNGVGLRKVFFIKVFYGALYLEELNDNGDDILDSREAKVFTVHAMRNISKKQMKREWEKEFERLCGMACDELRPFHEQFISYARDVKKGERIQILFLKDQVKMVTEGDEDFPPVKSPEYGELMLMSAIGPKPANKKFKKGLLGEDQVCD